ncbi:MAG: DUF1800 family protein [Pirellulaceae bacterium]|nr:DUF1800 family protein [Pirellulaceae bacterium]
MSKRFLSVARALTLFCGVLSSGQTLLRAADFAVATRDDVLVLTSKIQATQFLTHATFGATQVDIDALALQMRQQGTIAAASAWIDAQTALPASLHNPLERTFITQDYQFGSLWDRTGTSSANYTYVATVNGGTGTPGIDARNAFNRTRYRQHAWWHNVLAGEDQLRQRVAWALAQILAVGENAVNFNEEEYEGTVTNGPTAIAGTNGLRAHSRFNGLTNYYDIFVANAFGKYRTVVGKVTYHGIMGDWLSFRGNKRAAGGVFPDENYAREVMQLFTIGLNDLFDNGTARTNAQGVIPTYDADDIREYAQVFTGLGYGYGSYAPANGSLNPNSPYTGGVSTDPNGSVKFQVPMRMAPDKHDRGPKYLLNGLVLPSTSNTTGSPTNTDVNSEGPTHTEETANVEIDAALDGLVAHRSCPPFIVNRLIQRLVKSNPSKAYMARVVNIFKNNGQNVRGDLKAVVKAILLDPEAWQPIRVVYQRSPARFIVTTMGTEDSRLQEPVLTYTRFVRFFKSTAQYQKADAGVYPAAPVPAGNIIGTQFRLNSLDSTFDQSPYTQPSVFNFYVADYQPAGDVVNYVPSSRLQESSLFAPEFQLINAITSNTTNNFYRSISAGSRTETYLNFTGAQATSTNYENTANVTNVATESTRTVITYNFSYERSLLSDSTGPLGDAGSTARINALMEHLDMYLCGGTLSDSPGVDSFGNPVPGYRTSLKNAITAEVATAAPGGFTAAEINNIVRGAVMAIMTAPSFLVTE